ncbi:hypothetical protein [Clostridium sp. AM58-1XD]|uniref:hypothetical protein n=1 Tax=Clostridium sp. AM58-1XD TaxID=2292307 RepID=UPI000E4E8959|nr:hypothetical protein [Clostridium sp. AM58-1XD]RGY99097.1 hypothetical protein DXA13_09260 [Clostridium sp. AM58-1XD]
MKRLGTKAYDEIRAWIYRNARPLELALWQFYFEEGSAEKAAEILKFYQNEDGGFGNGIEPDCWNPESTPYATMNAAGILREIGMSGTGCQMEQEIFRYLESDAHCTEDGWLFAVPSNDGYPRAPWWSYDEKVNEVQSMGVTAGLCAYILRYGSRNSKVFNKACRYAEKVLDRAKRTEDFGEMGVGGLNMLIHVIEESGLSDRFDCQGLKARTLELANCAIERDQEKWAFYTVRPSEVIPSLDSPLYHGNEEIVEKELDYLIDTRNPGGVWNITWTWFQMCEPYAKEFAVSENWWKAEKAIEKMRFLRNFDRL